MKHNKRIGICANTSWNLVNFRLHLMKDMRTAGYEIIALAPRDEHSQVIINEGFKYIEIKNLHRKGTNPLIDLLLYREYKKILSKENIDVILLYTIKPVIYGSIAAKELKIPSIATITGLGYTFLNNSVSGFIAKNLYKYALKKADYIFFQNQDDIDLMETNNIIPANKASVINGSGIDTKAITPTETKPNKYFSFLFVGRMLIDKGIVELFSAFEKVVQKKPHTNLILVGDLDSDNPSSINEDLFKKKINHTNIIWKGKSNIDNVLKLMAQSDVIVLPSYREGIPRVILESMCLAKPVIVSDVPGCRQTIEDNKTGLLCRVKDVNSLADKMIKMIEMSDENRTQMGKKGRERVEKLFDQQYITKKYLDLLNSIDEHKL